MPEPMAMDIATLIAHKTVEALAEPTKNAVTKLVTKLRDRFRGDKEAETALALAESEPSPTHVEDLAHALERLSSTDPAFAQELRALWTLTRTDSTAHDNAVVNNFQGTAEKVIQLRDAHGDIHL
jgi:hypothetical protein